MCYSVFPGKVQLEPSVYFRTVKEGLKPVFSGNLSEEGSPYGRTKKEESQGYRKAGRDGSQP